MRQIIHILSVLISIVILVSCQQEGALNSSLSQDDASANTLTKPAPNLNAIINCNFTLTPPTFWNGTIEFENGDVYGITFVAAGAPVPLGQSSHFEEELIMYKLGTDWKNPDNVYLKGWNVGVVVNANKPPDPVKFHENGIITEAYGPFAEWLGRNIHTKGTVYWVEVGLPEKAVATFRLN